MRVPADLLLLAMAALALVGFRRTGHLAYLGIIAVGLGWIAVYVVELWPRVIIGVGAGDVVLLLGLVAVVAAVHGLPPTIARRINYGYRSREQEFDRRFFGYKRKIDAALAAYPSPPIEATYRPWQTRTIAIGTRVLKQMRRLDAPDAEWSALRDDYVDGYSEILRRIAHDEEHDAEEIVRQGTELKERAEALIRAYHDASMR